MNGRTANLPPMETGVYVVEDAVSQAGIDIGEFVIDLVKNSSVLKLNEATLREVMGSTLASLTLYIEDPDSPFEAEKEI